MAVFEDAVIKKMAPFFSPLFSGIHQLKDAVFPPGTVSYHDSPITHMQMIDIFNKILGDLPEEHTMK